MCVCTIQCTMHYAYIQPLHNTISISVYPLSACVNISIHYDVCGTFPSFSSFCSKQTWLLDSPPSRWLHTRDSDSAVYEWLVVTLWSGGGWVVTTRLYCKTLMQSGWLCFAWGWGNSGQCNSSGKVKNNCQTSNIFWTASCIRNILMVSVCVNKWDSALW